VRVHPAQVPPSCRWCGEMSTGLLDWLEDPEPKRGFTFMSTDGGCESCSFEQLAWSAHETASLILDSGIRRNQIVAIVMPNGRDFHDTFFGAWLAGGTPAPIAPPFALLKLDEYVAHLASLLAKIEPLVITTADLVPTVSLAIADAGLGREPLVIERTGARLAASRQEPAECALIQFTSGSTASPRATQIGWDNLEVNLAMLRDRFGMSAESDGVSWLPFWHDMGLIGAMVEATTVQHDGTIMTPELFVREPQLWLQRLGRMQKPSASPTTPFGMGYAAKKVSHQELSGLDFSNVESFIIGAERIDSATIERFIRLLEPFGLDRSAIRPGYGLGEATLAVSGRRKGAPLRVARPAWDDLAFGQEICAEPCELAGLDVGDGTGWVFGCGESMDGVEIRIVDNDGNALPEGHLGEILVDGPTVAGGYLDDPERTSERFTTHGLRTGDAGFLLAGELFVLGRMGDALTVYGRQVFVEELEAKLSATAGIKKGRCIVMPLVSRRGAGAAAIVEAPPGQWVEPAARQILRTAGGFDLSVQIYSADLGTIPKTSSGKPRRRVLWQRMLAGDVGAELVFDTYPSEAKAELIRHALEPDLRLARRELGNE
jgi:fatty-acyl-CoA synthase